MSADADDRLWRHLPAEFIDRLPPPGERWRARVALLWWCLGYPLEMSWSMAMDRGAPRRVRDTIERVDDSTLLELLDTTAASRPSAAYLSFWSVPDR